jgi:hypothetical protein
MEISQGEMDELMEFARKLSVVQLLYLGGVCCGLLTARKILTVDEMESIRSIVDNAQSRATN